MTEEELRIETEAVSFIKTHQKELVQRFASVEIYHPVINPVSLFMAGSPGAGKTEVSKSFVRRFQNMPVRIDADEIRPYCPGYTGGNAHIFQKAANKGVNVLYDYALHHDLNCILDGTFAYAGAEENINRSIQHNRKVELWFVYQDPIKAWEFTKVREAREARHVSKEVFIRAFFESQKNAHLVKEQFEKHIELNVLFKNYDDGSEDFKINVSANELDRLVGGRYSLDELQHILI